MSDELSQAVARSADAAGLHAPVPVLLLELQSLLGSIAATVAADSDRGRKPFRPSPEWAARLGELTYGVYLLADQTGVDVAEVTGATAARVSARAPQASASGTDFFER